jgi:transcriptional regulator GlxA family with amidase domain
MRIAILLYDNMTALDAVGPYEVLSRLRGATVVFVGRETGTIRTDTGFLGLSVDATLADMPDPDIIVVPGGPPSAVVDEVALDWLRAADRASTWTTSVCTGSLILGAAGLLAGRRATSNWQALDQLAAYGATPTSERVVFDGKYVTAAGVTAGLDMALTLAGRIDGHGVAQAIQLGLEYDPQPPYDAGSPDKAPERIVEALRAYR